MNARSLLKNETYEPVAKTETMMLHGPNSAIGAASLTIRRDRVEAGFSAKANLTAVLSSPPSISDPLATEARAAIRRIDGRANEDIDAWAAKLGNDLGSFQD